MPCASKSLPACRARSAALTTTVRSARTSACFPASGSRLPIATLKRTAMRGDQLEAGERRRRPRRARSPAVSSASSGDLQPDEGRLDRARLWKQFQRRRGDDAERALGADEQVAQIVAGVVLLQLATARSARGRRPAPLRARAPCRAPAIGQARRCRRHWSTDCRRWCSCPARRATAETAGRLPPRAPARSAGSRRLPPSWCWRRDRARAAGPSASATPPPRRCSGVWPPTSPVLPPCGTSAIRSALASAQIADTSAVEPGRSTKGEWPWNSDRSSVDIGHQIGGIGQRVLGADDCAELRDQFGRQRGRRQVHGASSVGCRRRL